MEDKKFELVTTGKMHASIGPSHGLCLAVVFLLAVPDLCHFIIKVTNLMLKTHLQNRAGGVTLTDTKTKLQ